MNIAVLGAGAWGTALSVHACANAQHRVTLWARDAALVARLRSHQENTRYLAGTALPRSLFATDSIAKALVDAELIVIATALGGLHATLELVAAHSPNTPLLWLCKGFDAQTGMLPHETAALALPRGRYGVLSGPSFAREVAHGLPAALTAASAAPTVCELAVEAFHHNALRVYTSDDLTGVEVGGAVKNVLAIATGIADSLQLGTNARAALITRGLAEMTRLAVALGGRAETVAGLTGLGDLVLTATGDLSRNRRVGLELGAGKPLAAVLAELGHVAEGVLCAHATLRLAQTHAVDMPITRAVCAVLSGAATPRQAVTALLAREAKAE
jgi:glycerol-3-phosphate dehydrogenase (NAD(P)+)